MEWLAAVVRWGQSIPSLYLWLNVGTLLGPLLLSFDRKVHFYKHWRHLLLGLLLADALFLPWDVLFTAWGVWSFNPSYLIGLQAFGLPLEEWLFFLTVPYATVFIYECYRVYSLPRLGQQATIVITFLLIGTSLILALTNYDKAYTLATFALLAIALFLHVWLLGRALLGNIYIGWAISAIPFLIVNGLLTAVPVVIYNDAENLGIRVGSIPLEDFFYGFLLYLLTISGMEWSRRKSSSATRTN